MTKEFKLSEKLQQGFAGQPKFIREDYVKEFIKRRNELDWLLKHKKITWVEYLDKRDKLSGEDLKMENRK